MVQTEEKRSGQRGQELNGNHQMAGIREERKVVSQVLWKEKVPGSTGHQKKKNFYQAEDGQEWSRSSQGAACRHRF